MLEVVTSSTVIEDGGLDGAEIYKSYKFIASILKVG